MLDSWLINLASERKSAETLKSYGDGVRRFLSWCAAEGRPAVLDRPTVAAFVVALLDNGAAPSTARSRQLAVRRFSAWLAAEGEIDTDQLVGIRPPKLDLAVVPVLDEDQLRALIKACAGPDMRDRRDEAVVRIMIETGARAGEVVALQIKDIDLIKRTATIRRGKGGKGRSVHIGADGVRAVDRYVRARRSHRLANTDALWLGDRGKEFSYDGLHKALKGRAERAGLVGFHPHVLRHTAASRWLAAGGSEGGLMATAGWSRRDMIDRYTAATASDRARAEAGRLDLGRL